MFESLSEKLGGIFDHLRRGGKLRPDDVDAAMREIRLALLEADVALPVVKDFIARVREQAVGIELIKSVTPAQQVVKIVHDEMVALLGGAQDELRFGSAPAAYLMVGLQGSGKTTSTAKLGYFLTRKQNKKILMASLDTQRPAAQDQLRVLGDQTGVATLPIVAGQTPLEIAKRAMKTGREEGYDLVLLDTAGRLSIDETLMNEVAAVRKETGPVETLLVADAMTGQDAVNVAKAFDDKVGLTGIILTRVDGDARGGAAMSMHAVTGKPIKMLGTGEKWDALEPFYPDRIAGRILGMGDVVSLVEKAAETVDREDAEKMAKKFQKGKFDFDDLLSQYRQMKKLGGIGALAKMLPGLGKMAGQLDTASLDDSLLKRQEAIILSMTPKERAKPDLMNASRKRRIANGSGTTVQEINKLIKQQQQMQTVMKRMKKMGMGKMMGMMKGMMGDKDAALLEQMDNMSPDEIEAMMAGGGPDSLAAGKSDSPLGPNPFAPGGSMGGAMPPSPFGGMGGMPGLAARGGAKKNRKKGRRK